MDSKDKTKKITSVLDAAGSATRTGILSGARFLASGIAKTSDYVKSCTPKTSDQSDVNFLTSVQKANKTASLLVGKTHEIIGKTVNKTIEVAEDVWYSAPQSEVLKKITESDTFKNGYEITKAGAGLSINLIGGLAEGINIVTSSSINATVDVVGHKYGQQAAKATQETFGIAGNLFGAYQMTYTTGLIGISASQVKKIKEQQQQTFENIINTLTSIAI